MNSIHTALFYSGWVVAVVAAFFIQSWVRSAARLFAGFWRSSISPALSSCNRFLGRHDTLLFFGGAIATVFGTLLCAASTHWIGITDVRAFAGGLALLVLGMASVIRAME